MDMFRREKEKWKPLKPNHLHCFYMCWPKFKHTGGMNRVHTARPWVKNQTDRTIYCIQCVQYTNTRTNIYKNVHKNYTSHTPYSIACNLWFACKQCLLIYIPCTLYNIIILYVVCACMQFVLCCVCVNRCSFCGSLRLTAFVTVDAVLVLIVLLIFRFRHTWAYECIHSPLLSISIVPHRGTQNCKQTQIILHGSNFVHI